MDRLFNNIKKESFIFDLRWLNEKMDAGVYQT